MERQRRISAELNTRLIGQKLNVLIDRVEDEFYVGRSEDGTPEVDPEIFVTSDNKLYPGRFYGVIVTGAVDYDLYAEMKII